MRPVMRALSASSLGNSLSILKRSTFDDAALSNSEVGASATTLPCLSMAMRLHSASASSR